MSNDQSWPDTIWSLNSDNLNNFKKMEDLKNYGTYQDYNRKYHRNRLLYKEYMSKKMSNLWTNRSLKNNDQENSQALFPDCASFRNPIEVKEIKDPISGINDELKIEFPFGLDVKDGHNRIQDIGKSYSEDGECCYQGGVTQSAGVICPCGRCFPKLFIGQNYDKHVKPKQHPVNGTNRNMKSRPGRVGFPKIHTKSSLVHNEYLPPPSVQNSFRRVNKMNGVDYKHSPHGGSSNSSVSQNTNLRSTDLTKNSLNHSADFTIDSMNQRPDPLTYSSPLRIESHSHQHVFPPKAACNMNHADSSEHRRQSEAESLTRLDRFPMSKTPSRKETKHAAATIDKTETVQQRPAQALHKVIFRTKDEAGVLVITAVGINEAAMMRSID